MSDPLNLNGTSSEVQDVSNLIRDYLIPCLVILTLLLFNSFIVLWIWKMRSKNKLEIEEHGSGLPLTKEGTSNSCTDVAETRYDNAATNV